MSVHDHKIETSNKQIRYVTNIGIVCNILLSAVKFLFGISGNSIALVADGFHSLSDMVTDFAVLIGVHMGSKAPDKKHPYGHGRAETFTTAIIAVALIVVGAIMIYRAAVDIVKEEFAQPGYAVLVVALVSVIVKELIYRITKKIAVKYHSPALYANAWHHRSDALSSIAVVIGFGALKFGFEYGDQVAAIVVGVMIILVGIKITGDCLRELTESAVDASTVEEITQIINSKERIHGWHKLRTRNVGREVFLDLHILVDPQLSIIEAHDISESLEKAIHEQIARPINVTVHIEPDNREVKNI